MDSRTRLTLAVGAAAGYAVGRSKKEKVALGLLSLVTGRAMEPMSLIGQGIRKFAESPQFEELSALLTQALEQQTRSLEGGQAEGETAGRTTAPGTAEERKAAAEEEEESTGGGAQGEDEHDEHDEHDEQDAPQAEEAEPPEPTQHRPARRNKAAASTSAHRAGPKNPPAAKAKAMGRKARAERATRRPGPKNPPAAKAMARKAADEQAARHGAPGKKPPTRRSR